MKGCFEAVPQRKTYRTDRSRCLHSKPVSKFVLCARPRMFLWTAERFRARSLRTAALIAPAGPQAPDSRAGDQERDAGSLTTTNPPLLMFQLNAREDSCLF